MYKNFMNNLGIPIGYARKIWLVMRLTTVILIASLLQVSASTLAQKISLSKSNAALKSVLKDIKQQSGYDFIATESLFKTAKLVNINIKQVDFEDALKLLFKDQPLTYSINKTTITIKEKAPSFLDRVADQVNAYLNNIDARGRIVDESGKPLEGATVVLKGTSRTVKTDVKGEFSISNVPDHGVLVIRYVGYKQLEISLKDAVMPLEIKLNVATGELEEVKVVYNTGYQELNKERATGSFVQIDNELFNRRVGATVLERISDLVPGLLNSSLRGQGNPLNSISIRGINTLDASAQPLLVVDNFIYTGDPNKLNPNDVESITILKDAAAASIWGARSGNGVIVITTKKGKINSSPAISFNTNVAIQEKPDLFSLPVVSSSDIISLERKRFADGFYNTKLNNRTTYPVLSQIVEILAKQRSRQINSAEANAQIALYENHDVRNDINKYLLQSGISQQYAFNLSGGTNNYQYYGSAGYDRSCSNDVNISNDRLTISFNNSWNPLNNLQIDARFSWGQSTRQGTNSGGYATALTSPYLRLADNDGNPLAIPKTYRMIYVDTVSFPGKLDWHYIPIDESKNGNSISKIYTTNITGSLAYKVINGLTMNVGYNWQKAVTDDTNIQSTMTFATRDRINQYTTKDANGLPVYPYPLGGIYNQSNADQTAWSIRGGLNFNQRLGKHDINALLGLEINESKSKAINMPTQFGYNPETNGFGAPIVGNWVVRPGTTSKAIGIVQSILNGNLNRFGAHYGNIGYTYDQKYTLTVSGRVDESNFFGVEANDRKKPLWSTGVKWNISNENFYKCTLLPNLSLSATYGYRGNVNAGASPMATATYYNGYAPLYLPYAELITPPNPELLWEQIKTINIAVNFGFKGNRVSGVLSFYDNKGTNLISPITVDGTSGFNAYTGNQSSLKTTGFDLGLNTKNIDGIFKWASSVNFAFQKDKVTAYSIEPPKNGQFSGIILRKPLSSIYSYHWAGLNSINGDALVYLGDRVVGSSSALNSQTQKDLIYSGQSRPPLFGSIFNNFSYKNISISVGINYRLGHVFVRKSFGGVIADGSNWIHKDYLRAWKTPGDELNTNVPGFLNTYSDQRYTVYSQSDILVEKGDYFRLQDVRLNYQINKSTIKKMPFKTVTLYVYGNNLGFIWKASKYNPDNKNDVSALPLQKSISAGLSANF